MNITTSHVLDSGRLDNNMFGMSAQRHVDI